MPRSHRILEQVSRADALEDQSPLFDEEWYVQAYPDVAASSAPPWRHYVEHGADEGRRPNAIFDPAWYATMCGRAGMHALATLKHYQEIGWREGLDPALGFSTTDHLAKHPELIAEGVDPLSHFLRLHGDRVRRIRGHVDVANTSMVSGWAWVAGDPTVHLEIGLWAHDEFLGSTPATRFRADLKANHIGDGFHSFEFRLPPGRCDAGWTLRALEVSTSVELANSPFRLSRPSEHADDDRPPGPLLAASTPSGGRDDEAIVSVGGLAGALLRADPMAVSGWIVDLTDPLRFLDARVLVDGRDMGVVTAADEPLSWAGCHPASRTFRRDFEPGDLVAEGMTVEVRVEGTDLRLTSESGTIATAATGAIDWCDGRSVRGWAVDWAAPDCTLMIEIYLNNQYVGEAAADQVRDELRRLGIKDGRAGFLFRLADAVDMEEARDVHVRAMVAGTHTELVNSPWWIGRAVRLAKRDGS